MQPTLGLPDDLSELKFLRGFGRSSILLTQEVLQHLPKENDVAGATINNRITGRCPAAGAGRIGGNRVDERARMLSKDVWLGVSAPSTAGVY